MLRKVLSQILILVFISGLLTTTASAETEMKDADELGLVYALGIVDETKEKLEEISRGEFAYCVGRLFFQDEALEEIEAGFSDCDLLPAAWQGAIGYLRSIGVVTGFSEGKFCPYESVGLNEAAKIILGIIDVNGFLGIAGNYISLASRKGLLDAVVLSESAKLTRLDTVRMLYNTLECNLSGTTHYSKTVLERDCKRFREFYMNLYEVTGVVTDNGDTSLYGATEIDSDEINVGGITISNYTGMDILGEKVKLYFRADSANEKNEFVWYCGTDKYNDFANFHTFINSSYASYKYTYYVDRYSKRGETAKLSQGFKLIYNERALKSGISFDDSYMLPDRAQIKLIDNNKDGLFDVVFIRAYETFVVKGIDTEDEKLYSESGETLCLRDYDSKVFSNDDGVEISSQDIFKTNTVLSVLKSLCGTHITVIKRENVLEGSVDMVSDDEIIIDGGLYILERGYHPVLKPGDQGKFYLDDFGSIIYYDANENNKIFAYVIAVDNKNKLRPPKIKLIDESNSVKAYELKEKLTLNGSVTSADSVINFLEARDDVDRLVRVKFNSENVISYIETVGNDVISGNTDFSIIDGLKKISGKNYYKHTRLFDGRAALASDAKVFIIAKNPMSDGDYLVTDNDYFDRAEYICDDATLYTTDGSSLASAMLLIAENMGRDVDKSENIYLVRTIKTVCDEQGTIRKELTLLDDTGEQKVMTEEENVLLFTDKNGNQDTVEAGDVIRYGYNREGYIDKGNLLVVYDRDKKYFNKDNVKSYNSSKYYANNVIQSFWVLNTLPGYTGVSFNEASGTLTASEKYLYPNSVFKKIYLFDVSRNRTTEITPEELVGYDVAGTECSYGVMYTLYYTRGFAVVYK